MNRIEWATKMAFGWLCYHVVIWISNDRVISWILPFAGFYAYSCGYEQDDERLKWKRGNE